MNEDRTYGVEIEITGTRELGTDLRGITNALSRSGIPAVSASYGSPDQPERGNWKVLPDASCGPEIVSPPLRGKGGLQEIGRVCQVLEGLGAEVSARCGLHVHHDAAGLTVRNMVDISALYAAHQRAINSILPASRRDNSYCLALGPHHVDRQWQRSMAANRDQQSAAQAMQLSRYSAVNWHALLRHGTVEFRQHHGTLDSQEMRCWVLLTQGFIEVALNRKSPVNKVRQPTGRKYTGPLALERELLGDLLFALSRATQGDTDYGEVRQFYQARLAA